MVTRNHKALILVLIGLLLGLTLGGLLLPGKARAQSMTDYTATPPFVNEVVPPNILILMDNSGSMTNRGCESTACGKLPDGSTSTTTTFAATTTYSGLFSPMVCYAYNTTDNRFVESTTKATVGTPCAGTLWDGNFLNWATFRRFDAVKKALIGGDCATARNSDGTCPPIGSPSLKTITALTVFDSTGRGHETATITGSGADSYVGRIPILVAQGGTGSNPGTLHVYLRGGTSGMQGTFCIDDDATPPGNTANSCDDGGTYLESQFRLRVGVSSEPTGVIQQIGSKARFGLMVFKGAGDGGRILTGIGSRQSIDFNGTSVETFATNTAAMVDAVGEAFPTTWTPLAESLYEAARYVAQINSAYTPTSYTYPIAFAGGNSNGVSFQGTGTGSIGSTEVSGLTGGETCPAGYIASGCGRDPYFFGSNHLPAWASPSAQVPCCKTFVIVFTDGEPTQDLNIPAALQNYAGTVAGLQCTGGSGTIHAPNGTCNTNPATPPSTLLGEHKTDYGSNGSHYLNDVAYWAHTVDLRQATIPGINVAGHDLAGTQNITVYTFYAFGDIAGREILMHAAKEGGFEDSNGNSLPDVTGEWDKQNNYTSASGADGLPDTYFESANVDDLQGRMLAAITSILQRSSSGTSISVLATSATGDGALYQAYFYPAIYEGVNQIKWTGYTQGLFIDSFGNLREDTNGDGRLVYSQDTIVSSRFDPATSDVKVDRFADTDGDGKADSTTPFQTIGLREVLPIWEAGRQLADMTPASRNILTWVDQDNDGRVDAGEQVAFSIANQALLSPYLNPGAAPFTADNIINFIRGTQVAGLRDRQLTVSGSTKVWKLGDPVHATPVVIGSPRERFDVLYGDASYIAYFQQYKDRRQVAYVGANDGMLHAFNAGFYHRGDDPATSLVTEHGWFTRTPTDNSSGPLLGEELWGFIPYQLLPQLRWLTQSDYTHVYYVDLKPKVTDARIFIPDADHPNGWGTILIGGFRLGGSCNGCTAGTGAAPMTVTADFGSGIETRSFYSAYFILDVTNPNVNPTLLWSFSTSDLGLTTSYPAVVRVSPSTDAKTDNTNAQWYTVVGTGPTSYGGTSTQDAKVYAALMPKPWTAGSSPTITTFPTSDSNAFVGDLITYDKDLDFRSDAIYGGDIIQTGGTPVWNGKLYRLTTASPTLTTWGVSSGGGRAPAVLISTFICTPTPCGGTNPVGPIAAAPTITRDDANQTWLFFGTGRYFSITDRTNSDVQHFFGVKDPVMGASCTETTVTNCERTDLVDVSSANVCVVCDTGVNQVTGVSGVTDLLGTATTTLQGLIQTKHGWVTSLPTARERVIVSPTLVGGIVFFPSFVPNGDVCTATGNSYLYALFYLTGSAYKESVIGLTQAGANTNVNRSLDLGAGLSSGMAVHIGATNTDAATGMTGRVTVCGQSSTGALSCRKSGTPLSAWSRYVSWNDHRT